MKIFDSNCIAEQKEKERLTKNQRNINLFLTIVAFAGLALHFELPGTKEWPTKLIGRDDVRKLVVSSHQPSEEGIGSAIQDIKYTLVMTALLGADLELPLTISEHGYDTSSFLTVRASSVGTFRGKGQKCALKEHMSERTIKALVRKACSSAREFERVSQMLSKVYVDCSVIKDFNFTQPRTEEFNACTAKWIREHLIAASSKRRKPRGHTSNLVVYHNRAGDMGQGDNANRANLRVLRPVDARAALAKIQSERSKRMKLLIVSEDKNVSHYEAIKEFNFTIAVGDNWVEEITQAAGAHAAVLSKSSFSVLVAQVSGARTIYAKCSETRKFLNFESFGVTINKLGKNGEILNEPEKKSLK